MRVCRICRRRRDVVGNFFGTSHHCNDCKEARDELCPDTVEEKVDEDAITALLRASREAALAEPL